MARTPAILLGAGLAALLLKKKKRKMPAAEPEERTATPVSATIAAPEGTRAQLLVFTAEWCGTCKAVLPKIHDIENDQPNVDFEYIDADENPEIAKEFNIRGVPTFVAMRDGKEVDRLEGYRSDEAVETLMKAALGWDEGVKALPPRMQLPVIQFGADYMTGKIPTGADYRPSQIYTWMPMDTKGHKIIVGPKACQYCTHVAEPKDGRGAYCTLWKAKVVHNYVCNDFKARADL